MDKGKVEAGALACEKCNGQLASALLAEMTPEYMAHRFAHTLAERDALRDALAALANEILVGTEPSHHTEPCYRLRSIAMDVLGFNGVGAYTPSAIADALSNRGSL